MYKLTEDDLLEFAKWFMENTDIPEGVEAFKIGEDGAYAWEPTRAGLVNWVDMRCAEALVESGITQITRFGAPLYWILAEDGRTPKQTNSIALWAQCMGNEATKRVAYDRDDNLDISVSTVFLGIDHGYGGGAPVLFETMIFGGKHNDYQERYCTWEGAELGHQEACDLAGIQRKLSTWIEGQLDA
jgi:hypothetical protein